MHEWMDLQPYVAKGLCAVEGGLYLQWLVKIELLVKLLLNWMVS